jgi:single-stranded-DNA-specific exonuclease
LNAAGRISEASITQHLLGSSDPSEAERLADELEALNSQRRDLASAALDDARSIVQGLGEPLPPAIVVQSSFPTGVLGLVAVRLVEETDRPVAVVERADGLCRGSVRAPSRYDAVGAVASCAEHLIRFGGHKGAAGFAVDAASVEAFSAAYVAAVAHQPVAVPTDDGLVADCLLRTTTVTEDLLDLLARLGPFGQGAPEPLFESASLQVREARIVGDRHLRLKLWGDGRVLVGIAFNGAGDAPPVGSTVDVLYRVRPNVWQGQRRAELQVVAWRPTAGY